MNQPFSLFLSVLFSITLNTPIFASASEKTEADVQKLTIEHANTIDSIPLATSQLNRLQKTAIYELIVKAGLKKDSERELIQGKARWLYHSLSTGGSMMDYLRISKDIENLLSMNNFLTDNFLENFMKLDPTIQSGLSMLFVEAVRLESKITVGKGGFARPKVIIYILAMTTP